MLYLSSVSPRSGDFGGSVLLACKLQWQSVMFVGYSDDREMSEQQRLEKLDRQVFVKRSYAIQRRAPPLSKGCKWTVWPL